MADVDAVRLLEERDPRAFEATSAAIAWKGFRITAQQLRRARGSVAVSFGSCSFREPADELQSLILV
jgi:hypothetical protein